MNGNNKIYQLNSDLKLYDSSYSPLPIHITNLTLTEQDNTLTECRLTFQVNWEIYYRIDTEALFNLKPELRGSLSNGEFKPEANIEIEASLQPEFLSNLTENITNPEQTAAYLQNLSQDNPLLSTENWFALHVKQQQESGETGYRTFWAYLPPSAISQENISQEEISAAMVNFFKDWSNTNLSEMNQDVMAESINEMTKGFSELADTNLEETQDAISEIMAEITNAFEEFADVANEVVFHSDYNRNMLEEIINFFTKDDWPFIKIQGEPVLQTTFQGQNGKWNCYAKAWEEEEQFVFYSICPIDVPENKRGAIAEFITRANYGTIIGNFELDYADGEVRYKTSIDVEGSNVTFPLIKQLVYANVTMMDEYLPGIVSVIEGDVEPKDAIAQIELIEPSSSSDLSSNLTDTQTPVTSPSPPEELILNPEHQTAIGNPVSVQLETISDILSLLTREEIAQFHRSIQLEGTYQIKVAQTILAQLQSGLQTRLGELGEQVFDRAYKLLKAGNLDSKSLKFIQRYAELAAKISCLKEESKRSDLSREITELSEISSLVEARLSQLTKNGISGKEEIEMLIEIEDLKRQLADRENLLKSWFIPTLP